VAESVLGGVAQVSDRPTADKLRSMMPARERLE